MSGHFKALSNYVGDSHQAHVKNGEFFPVNQLLKNIFLD